MEQSNQSQLDETTTISRTQNYDITRYNRISRHLDWYLRLALGLESGKTWTMKEIASALHAQTGFGMKPEKIRRYNARQFLENESAPLVRVSEDEYRINAEYYEVMGKRVAETGSSGNWARGKYRPIDLSRFRM